MEVDTCIAEPVNPAVWFVTSADLWPVSRSRIAVTFITPQGRQAIVVGTVEHVDRLAGTMRFALNQGHGVPQVCPACREALSSAACARVGTQVNHPPRILAWRYA